MRHLLFIFLLLPSMLFAQDDAKYLKGAVPEVDGKVIFSKQFSAPNLSQKQIADNVLAWAKKRFIIDGEQNGKVAYTTENNNQITCFGNEQMILKKTALSLDRTRVSYRLTIDIQDGKCDVKLQNISYAYNVSYQKEPEIYMAEDWIVDKVAYPKNKLSPGTKKFRIKTIDLMEELFTGVQSAIGSAAVTQTENTKTTPTNLEGVVVTAIKSVPRTDNIPSSEPSDLTGYKKISPDKIPGNIIKMLTEDWMLITAGNNQQFNMMTASWGGLGRLYNKPTATCFINPARHTYQLMEKNDTYTLSFYTEAYREALNICGSQSGKDTDKVKTSGLSPITTPTGSKAFGEAWLIIECRKLVSQSIDIEGIHDEKLKKEWTEKPTHKMFIGEIINVWVK